jgi:hypothetical protein
MLLKPRSTFFTPSCTHFPHHTSRANILVLSNSPVGPAAKRSFRTYKAGFGSSSGGGIPLGRIDLGSGAKTSSPQKGIAIKDDITKSWKELSVLQKIVRTGTQTTNFIIVVVGIGVLVLY